MKLWKQLAIAAGTAALTTAVGYAAKRAVLTYLGRGTHNGPRLIPAVAGFFMFRALPALPDP